MICIICRIKKDKSDFSVEHIIPKSLGNSKLTINTVCKECNDKLGSQVDSELVNFEIFSYPRNKLDLKGNTWKLPKMFNRSRLEDGRPVTIKYNKKTNKLDLETPTIIKSEKEGDGFRYEIKSSSTDDAIKKLKKSYKRNTGKLISKKDEERILAEFNKNVKSIENPIITNKLKVNLLKLELAFLKIAYELIFYLKILNKDENYYLIDNRLELISKTLSDYIYRDKKPEDLPFINKAKGNDIKQSIIYLSEVFFGHKFCHSITIAAFENERKIKYNINLLNSFDRYIIIDNIDCKNFNKTMYIDPVSTKVIKTN